MSITILFAPPGVGKTSYMSFLMNERAFDVKRNIEMKKEINRLNENGFKLSVPEYSIASNYTLICRRFRYSSRPALRINPYRLGFHNVDVNTHFLPPYTTVAISEAQKYFNSRKFALYPDWQSRYYEAHRHNLLDFYLDTQRPDLIDVNIRDLSNFVHIVDSCITNNTVSWVVREIDSSKKYELYSASGFSDKSCYEEKRVTVDKKVLKVYNTRECQPLFYDGNEESDFYNRYCEEVALTKINFIDYSKKFAREIPDKFYKRERG